MSVTPQTNTTLAEIADFLVGHDRYAICGHVSPDGDCLGSQLALKRALQTMGKSATVILAQRQPIEAGLTFLPDVDDLVVAEDYAVTPDVCIALDVPNEERLGPSAAIFHRAPETIVIDHHRADVAIADFSYTDPDAPSTSLLIWRLIEALGRERFSSEDLALMAECAYTGLVTDTGRFAYQNATEEAFDVASDMVRFGAKPQRVAQEVYQNRRLASLKLEERAIRHLELLSGGAVALSWIDDADMEECGAVRADAEPLIDVLRSLGGVRIACCLRDRGRQVRGSLRAKDDTDVAAIARTFDGGGHRAAAGFTINATLSRALEQVRAALLAAVS